MKQFPNIRIRPIEPTDDPMLARIIRETLAEFGANHPGTVYFDEATDHLSELFHEDSAAYFVAEVDGIMAGGGGIFPTKGLPDGTCELVKMYLLPFARGCGLGRELLEKCMQTAREKGFDQIYLETMPELKQALKLYEKMGFRYLCSAMGDSGHFGCDLHMIRAL
ncbi:MAG: GNAT family N-acetyltransferase [Marinilabiliales bacterium]|nr:GNAT family N-acetyltransferase [Marinilabiliales bacterium]